MATSKMLPEGAMLGVWAHPDDETYLSAGLMADAARRGQRVVCVTATRGEEGSWDEERWPTSEMGRVREAEMMASLQVLGVTEHHWLDYYDGTCKDVPSDEGVGRVRSIMEEISPRSVFTFGPDGMTGHDDHKAVCAWTTEAFERAAPIGAIGRSTVAHKMPSRSWRTNRCDVSGGDDCAKLLDRRELAR